MRRREFVLAFSGAAAWPLVARAQQVTAPLVGILASVSPGPYAPILSALKKGLRETGFVDGQNVGFEYRWAEGQYDQLQRQAVELVRRGVAVIVLMGGGPTVPAAKAATATIPIVFVIGDDPVKAGIVASLNRPGGNITGVSLLSVSTEAKRLQFLHEMVPGAADIGAIINPANPQAGQQTENLQEAARTLGIRLQAFHASSAGEIDAIFSALPRGRQVGALTVTGDAFFNSRAEQLVALSAKLAIPTMYVYRQYPAIGGLASYGPSLADAYRQAGIYAGRILRGEKAADLPVQQVVKIELAINLKTATALGLTVPLTMLSRADEVIE